MSQTPVQSNTLVTAVDLGTGSTTAQFAVAVDSFDGEGKLQRQKGRLTEMRAWPGGRKNDTIGNTCLPTDLIYDRATSKLLFWGFQAQQYLDDPSPDIKRQDVFIVEHVKLLLNAPDDDKKSTAASARYSTMRRNLQTLGKDPYEVFEDFLNEVTNAIICEAKRLSTYSLDKYKHELALAFPSGWPEHIHQRVAAIGAKAMHKSLKNNGISSLKFGIENVFTVSETLCGVKEWLTATIEDASISVDLGPQVSNLAEIQEGDCFLPFDIGGGTGCMTLLKLVSKHPLQVDQLEATQSMDISGEAVEAEFEQRLRSILSPRDYKGDLDWLIYHVCREFKEEKKNCGQPPRPGSSTWNIPAPRLRKNSQKGFEKDCLKLDRKLLDECFDPVIDTLESEIQKALDKHPEIKALVFLGQFGGSSDYLRNRMAKSAVSKSVKLYHSQSGKMDVVKGAMSGRISLQEKFVRKSATLRSYGMLVEITYSSPHLGHKLFPNAVRDGAVPFKCERGEKLQWLKVIEWAIPKGTILDENLVDASKNGPSGHRWPFDEQDIGFEDIIIISDEVPPPPGEDGKSYTLWTVAHEKNQLFVNNEQLQVEQIPFGWDLNMSEKLDPEGNIIGSYELHEVDEYIMIPEQPRKYVRRKKYRQLWYDLVWNITEMQVKIYVRPIFPHPTGPLAMQLAQERHLREDEIKSGESRSCALIKDIEVTTQAPAPEISPNEDDPDLTYKLFDQKIARYMEPEYQQQPQAEVPGKAKATPTKRPLNAGPYASFLDQYGGPQVADRNLRGRRHRAEDIEGEPVSPQRSGSIRPPATSPMSNGVLPGNAQLEERKRLEKLKRKSREDSASSTQIYDGPFGDN